jgi:peroxiredoxin
MLSRMRRDAGSATPQLGAEAPEIFLPSAQGGQFRLSMRTVRGPVVVGFYDAEFDGDEAFFKALAGQEDEINLAGGSVVAVGVAEPDEARDFVRRTGLKSYVLYDYAGAAARAYGLLERRRKNPDRALPATFLIGGDGKVLEAWMGERPDPAALLAKVSEITGLPKAPEEEDAEKPKRPKPAAEGDAAEGTAPGAPAEEGAEKPKKMTAEERERIKAERRAARAEGRSLKTGQPPKAPDGGGAEAAATPERPKLSPEERERRRAERRAEREAATGAPVGAGTPAQAAEGGARPKMTAEERERIKAERRAARAEGRSLKTPQPSVGASGGDEPASGKPADKE